MNKRSVILILFQIANLIVSFFTTFYIASCLTSELYAVVSVSFIITSLTNSFSFTGLDNYVSRNLYYWRKTNKQHYSLVMTTNAMFYRFIFAIIIQIPLSVYYAFLSVDKFEGNYYFFFLLFGILSSLTALNDTLNLILRADNRFVLAAFYAFLTVLVSKLFTLFIFLNFGFSYYLYSLSFAPLVMLMLQIKTIKRNFSFRVLFSVRQMLSQLIIRRYLLYSSYASFIFNYVDNFIISLMLPANVLGSYSFMKQIYAIGKMAIDNILDPVLLNLVALKNMISKAHEEYKRIYKIGRSLFVISLICIPILILCGRGILEILHLDHYHYIYPYIICCYLALIAYLFMKIPFYINVTIDSEYLSFKIYLVTSTIYIISSGATFGLLPPDCAALTLLISNLLIIGYLFSNRRNSIWNQISSYSI